MVAAWQASAESGEARGPRTARAGGAERCENPMFMAHVKAMFGFHRSQGSQNCGEKGAVTSIARNSTNCNLFGVHLLGLASPRPLDLAGRGDWIGR